MNIEQLTEETRYEGLCARNEEYERLCAQYGEKPRYKKDKNGNKVLNSTGKHATSLKDQEGSDMSSF